VARPAAWERRAEQAWARAGTTPTEERDTAPASAWASAGPATADPALAQPPPPGDATPLARSAGASAAWSAGAQGRAGWPPPLPRKPLEAPPPAPTPPPSALAQELSASKLFSRSGLSRALLGENEM